MIDIHRQQQTKRLHEESRKYFDAVNGMLDHQIGFSNAITEIYKPISGRVSDPTSFHDEGNDAGIEACEQYISVVEELKTTLAPELEMIETRIIRPADELTEVIKLIRKTATKRSHKQLDYDRHRATLKKLQDKKDRTAKDEKNMYKAEADVELATQEFEFYNDLLKKELPELFRLEREFIQPLFQSFYYMQLNIFYTLHERMQRLQIPYFELEADIEAAFEKKRGDVQERAEALTITKFKTHAPRMKLEALRKMKADKEAAAAAGGPPQAADEEAGIDNPPPSYSTAIHAGASTYGAPNGDIKSQSPAPSYGSPAPSYTTPLNRGTGSSASAKGNWSAAALAKKKPAPPPPKPKPKSLVVPKVETATAMYDFEAQAEGDLTFSAGETIEIVSRTQNTNEWWVGKAGGKEGQFPGNYVRLN